MNLDLFIGNPKNVIIADVKIPEHLRGIFNSDDMRAADLERLSDELRNSGSSLDEKISSKVIWRMGFPGMILDVNALYSHGENVLVNVTPIHPHRADLAYKGDKTLPRNVIPLTAGTILYDKDGYAVLGVRGGNVEAGKVAIFPGGHVDYIPGEHPVVMDNFLREFNEELGRDFKSGTERVGVIGVMDNKDTRGLHVLYRVSSDETYEQIKHSWQSAKDRAEHTALIAVNHNELVALSRDLRFNRGQKTYETNRFFADCFGKALNKYA